MLGLLAVGSGWNPRREKSVGDRGLRKDIEVGCMLWSL